MGSLVKDISDTAKWVAVFRAEESERPDAVFHDPFARKLAGEKGVEIADRIAFSRKNSWTFVARTFLFDQYIRQHVELGFDLVLNIAAGLDARPYRMDLPASLKWIDVDLPEILEYKNEILKKEKPRCDLKTIPLDLSDRQMRVELFENLNKSAGKALVATEGLMIYLTPEEVADLSLDLSAQSHFYRWLFDLASPAVLEMAKREMQPALKGSGAVFKFAPEEGEEFFERYGWKHLESKSKLKTAAALNRLSDEMKPYADMPEPPGPRRSFPWTGACLFENANKQ